MRLTLLTCSAALLLGAGAAHASDQYTKSIRGCEAAIAERLGVAAADLRTRLKGVDSAPRHRDLDFSVSALGGTEQFEGVKVSCRARASGEVLALTFDEATLPTALAQQ